MTRDEMRQAVLRVLELPIPDSDEEREKWRQLVAEQIVDALSERAAGFRWQP